MGEEAGGGRKKMGAEAGGGAAESGGQERKGRKQAENVSSSAVEMDIHGKKNELHSLEVPSKFTQKPGFFDVQAENILIKQSSTMPTNSEMKLKVQSSQHKTCKKQAVCKMSLMELETSVDVKFEQAKDDNAIAKLNAFDAIVSSENTARAGFEEMATIVVPKLNASRGLGGHQTAALARVEETITGARFLEMEATFEPQRWDSHIFCELCHRGPSLSLGEWYSCCCGSRLQNCKCRVISSMAGGNEDSVNGKVHKVCALWSVKVFNKNGSFKGLSDIVKLGKLSVNCARCHTEGATLDCHAAKCTQVFHYPCADMLASKLRCRMWRGPQFRVACPEHQPFTHLDEGSYISNKFLKKAQKVGVGNASACTDNKKHAAWPNNEYKSNVDATIEISSDSDGAPKRLSKASGPSCTCILHALSKQCSCNRNLPMNEAIALPRYNRGKFLFSQWEHLSQIVTREH
ncbi:hypothetical protein L7F22_013681 [Adiantum nelumboides]|nr:hypothetical protein [Adiantum nelumboides]